MNLLNNREYYLSRVEKCRSLAERAASPQIAAIHSELATRYERTLSTMAPETSAAGPDAAHAP